MKSYTVIVLLLMFSCKQQKPHGSLAFDFVPESESELADLGFKEFVFKSPGGKETILKGSYDKLINDTMISFVFEDGKLLQKSIGFRKKLFDSTELLNNLQQSGMKLMTPKRRRSDFDLYDSRTNLRYEVNGAMPSRWIRLVLTYAESSHPSMQVPPPVDSVEKGQP